MDRARKKTNKLLKDLERRVKAVYKTDPSLLRIQEQFREFMNEVDEVTHDAYLAYKNAPIGDERDKLKKAYMKEVRRLTLESREYKDLIAEFTRIMAGVNQKALDYVNAEMTDIYTLNYNQVAVDCKKVGIKVVGDSNG